MPSIYTANGIKAAMVFTYNGQQIVHVYHFTKGAPATLTDLQALATYLQSWDTTWMKPLRTANSNWVKCETRALDSAGSPVWDLIPVVNHFGTQGGTGLASFQALCVRHTTGLGGRSYRGRTYWCMFSDAVRSSLDYVTNPFSVLVTNAFNALRTGAASAGFTFVVNSMYSGVDGSGKAIPRAAGLMTPIIASEAGIALDTNRHRKISGVR